MFYGMPSKIFNKSHKNIEGVIGFVGGLINTIKTVKPTHIAIFFDSEEGSSRNQINPDYKSNRPSFENVEEIDNPFAQLSKIYEAIEVLNIKYQEIRGQEVDDVIASYALTYGDNIEVIISSADSDYFQLVNNNVKVFRYKGKHSHFFTKEKVLEKYGVLPEYFADYKALVGDASDNIKGVPQVGPKTAAKLINQFGGIEEIINNIEHVESKKISDNLKIYQLTLRLNLQIIKLMKGEVIFKLDECLYETDRLPTSTEVLRLINIYQ
jgi:DNA polymerase-1